MAGWDADVCVCACVCLWCVCLVWIFARGGLDSSTKPMKNELMSQLYPGRPFKFILFIPATLSYTPVFRSPGFA